MSKLNESFLSSNSFMDNTFIISKNVSDFIETSCFSVLTDGSVKVSEIASKSSSNKCGTADTDIDKCTNNWEVDSGILDSANNTLENGNLIEFNGTVECFNQNSGVNSSDFISILNDIKIQGNEFHNSFQDFNDTSLLNFFENTRLSSNVTESSRIRFSLYEKFDPLYAKNLSESNSKSCELRETGKETDFECDNLNILSSEKTSERKSDKNQDIKQLEIESNVFRNNECNADTENNVVPAVLIKALSSTSSPQSLEFNLISFDLPVINNRDSIFEKGRSCNSEMIYTEKEFQQALKMQEYLLQEKYTRKQENLKEILSKRQQEFNEKLKQQKRLSNGFSLILEEIMNIALSLSDKEILLKKKLESIENENEELKLEINKSVEDTQNIENAFSNLHKRYEQCKKMLKVYIDNEKNIVEKFEHTKIQVSENRDVPSEFQEQLYKCNNELEMVKKNFANQVEEIKTKLQQAELKISNYESNLKLVRTENEKLNTTYNDLISKIHKT